MLHRILRNSEILYAKTLQLAIMKFTCFFLDGTTPYKSYILAAHVRHY